MMDKRTLPDDTPVIGFFLVLGACSWELGVRLPASYRERRSGSADLRRDADREITNIKLQKSNKIQLPNSKSQTANDATGLWNFEIEICSLFDFCYLSFEYYKSGCIEDTFGRDADNSNLYVTTAALS